MTTFTINAIDNDYNYRGFGKTLLRFVFDTKVKKWTRIDKVPGAVLISQARYVIPGQRCGSDAAQSSTVVVINLAQGDLVATINRGGKKATALQMVSGEELVDVEFRSKRNEAGCLDVVTTTTRLPSLRTQ